MQIVSIALLEPQDFDLFLAYINDHLSDNGRGDTPYFQPMPRKESRFPADKAAAFKNGMQTAMGEPGWRRLWVARDSAGQIAGHIDLRALPERHAAHRCLLGMGVERRYRKRGLGGKLLVHAAQWAQEEAGLQWIDLQVLSVNQPAIALYLRAGFERTGEVPDMFQIDGHSFSYTSMSKRLA